MRVFNPSIRQNLSPVALPDSPLMSTSPDPKTVRAARSKPVRSLGRDGPSRGSRGSPCDAAGCAEIRALAARAERKERGRSDEADRRGESRISGAERGGDDGKGRPSTVGVAGKYYGRNGFELRQFEPFLVFGEDLPEKETHGKYW